jgi:hypothetical protein
LIDVIPRILLISFFSAFFGPCLSVAGAGFFDELESNLLLHWNLEYFDKFQYLLVI